MLALPAAAANAPLREKRLALYPQADANGDGILTDGEEDAMSRRILQLISPSPRGRRNTAGAGERWIGGKSVTTAVLGLRIRDLRNP